MISMCVKIVLYAISTRAAAYRQFTARMSSQTPTTLISVRRTIATHRQDFWKQPFAWGSDRLPDDGRAVHTAIIEWIR